MSFNALINIFRKVNFSYHNCLTKLFVVLRHELQIHIIYSKTLLNIHLKMNIIKIFCLSLQQIKSQTNMATISLKLLNRTIMSECSPYVLIKARRVNLKSS